MNDDNLKKIFKKDHLVPDAPINEWHKIKANISTPKSMSFKLGGTLSALALTSVLLFVVININSSQLSDQDKLEAMTYILDDSVFEESTELYTWIE